MDLLIEQMVQAILTLKCFKSLLQIIEAKVYHDSKDFVFVTKQQFI